MTTNLPVIISVSDMTRMADAVVKSKLFGITKVEEALTLMLIAQAEGSHPAIAIRDYHIIQGKPALKADAMLSRFQAAGGKVKWIVISDERVAAEFSHPQGGTAAIDWDMARAKKAQLGSNGMWGKYPRQMLRARVISEGIRTVFPGVIVGSYTPEEVQDFDDPKKQEFSGETIEHAEEKPNLTMELWREQQEQIYDQALANINGAADLESLQLVWEPYSKTIKTLDEDLRVDLIQKKNKAKEKFTEGESGLDAKLKRAEKLVS